MRTDIRPVSTSSITREEILATASLIRPHIRRTPIIDVAGRDLGVDLDRVTLKLEYLQHAGSFKSRGAFTNLLMHDVPAAGVAAASGGNHGAAVAFAAQRLKIPAHIFVPTVASPAKIEQIRSYGAELVVGGDRYQDALDACNAWIATSGAMAVHAFDQRETLLGQGTLAAELSEQSPDLDALLVAVGGGGLIGGIAAWYQNDVRVVGVEPDGAPTLAMALDAGKPVDAPAGSIAADSLAPKRVGELMFPIAQQFVDRVVMVSDDDIRRTQAMLWDTLRIVAEPGGAAALSALASGRYAPAGGRVGVVICGANTVITRP
jgi:threonine dehydratase